jgi:hypothetical protein
MDVYMYEIAEMKAERARIDATRGTMPSLLDEAVKRQGVLLVHARTGRERLTLHAWAKTKGLSTVAVCSPLLPKVRGYRACCCGRVYYEDEVRSHLDWSVISPGMCNGTVIQCPQCDDSFYDDDDDDDSGLKLVPVMLNGVAMAADYALLVKTVPKKQRRSSRRLSDSSSIVPLDQMPEREIILLY